MPYRLDAFAPLGLDEARLDHLIAEHRTRRVPRLDTFWRYFRNPMEPRPAPLTVDAFTPTSGRRSYRLAQEAGLPSRLTAGDGSVDRPQREIVIENDIAWRIQTMVDFMFGKPLQVLSTAADEGLRRTIERVLDAVWEASGGIALLQDMALLGHVYGYVDLVLRLDESALIHDADSLRLALDSGSTEALSDLIRIEVVEPRRGIPVLHPADYRRLNAYIIHVDREASGVASGADAHDAGTREDAESPDTRPMWIRRWSPRPPGRGAAHASSHGAARGPRTVQVVEVLGPGVRQVYHAGALVRDETSALLPGVLPVAHIQNISQPFRYEGVSEVEPLIPLQDELNTRLSDRANRVTLQSFKMYLAKGFEPLGDATIGPGQLWRTDNTEASIEAFGGDSASPSESEHIEQVREAMDKLSAVPPLAGGVVRAKIGNLSSANALRITLLSLLSKTARKRVAYGAGIARISRMVLAALDAAGVLRTGAAERGVRLVWPDPQPIEPTAEVQAARQKVELGVPQERVLAELGYAPTDPGIA